MSALESLKRKLCAALDELGDADGFVLVATAEDVSFTRLKAAGWYEDRVLELEPLNEAEARQEYAKLADSVVDLRRAKEKLDRDVAAQQELLDTLNTAIAHATGQRSEV